MRSYVPIIGWSVSIGLFYLGKLVLGTSQGGVWFEAPQKKISEEIIL